MSKRSSGKKLPTDTQKQLDFYKALSTPLGITRGDAKKRFGWKDNSNFSQWLNRVESTYPVRIIRPDRAKGVDADTQHWRCEPLATIPLEVPTDTAALFAHLCTEFGQAMLGTAGRDVAKFAKHLRDSMPQQVRDELGSLKGRLKLFFRETRSGMPGVFSELVAAIASNQVVEMDYESVGKALAASASAPAPPASGGTKARKKPAPKLYQVFGVYFAKRSLYAIVREHGKYPVESLEGLWSARVDRIKSLKLAVQTFAPPGDFSVDTYMQHAWEAFRVNPPKMVTVKIRVDPKVHVNIASTTWHRTQKYEKKGGEHLYSFRVDGFDEMKYWILSLGSGVEVVSPPECRAEMARLIEEMSSRYRDGSGRPAPSGGSPDPMKARDARGPKAPPAGGRRAAAPSARRSASPRKPGAGR